MKKLVAFTGPMGSGKTTAAEFLEVHGWAVLSFAAPLKRAARDIFHLTEKQVYTMAGKQAKDPRWGMSPREILQKLGTEAMRNTFPGVWVKHTELSILTTRRSYNVVIDDLRFPDEADMIRELGGTVIHIRGRDAYNLAAEADKKHASEQVLPVKMNDLVFQNKGSLEEFKNQVLSIL